MSHHGPDAPSDPWEQSAGYPDLDEPGQDEPTALIGQPAAPAEPPAEQSAPAPGRSRGPAIVLAALVGVLVVVLCGGGVAALYLIGTKDRQPPAARSAPPSPSSRPSSPSPRPSPTFDPGSIIKGNCVVNEGPDAAPVLRVVPCGPGTYQVLVRIDSTADVTKCRTVPGATHHYYYETTPPTLDFVLCLKKQ